MNRQRSRVSDNSQRRSHEIGSYVRDTTTTVEPAQSGRVLGYTNLRSDNYPGGSVLVVVGVVVDVVDVVAGVVDVVVEVVVVAIVAL